MKKKVMILSLIVIAIIISLAIGINLSKAKYTVKATKIELNSPDRVLTVFKEGKEVEFDSIYYLDDVFICDNNNPTVGKSAIQDGEKLKVKLKNKKVVKAIVEEE